MPGRAPVRVVALTLALLAAGGGARTALAQQVLGPFEDATPAPRGILRVGTGLGFAHWADRFDPGGGRAPFYASLDADTVGVRQFPRLAGAQSDLATLTATPDFSLSLGSLQVRSRARVTTIPFVFEAGLTRRLTLGVTVPYVRTFNTVVPTAGADRGVANVGINPAIAEGAAGDAARAENGRVYTQLEAARAQLAARIAACQAAPAGDGCAAIAASPSTAQALVAESARFAEALARVYGLATGTRSPVVPAANTAAAQAVVSRLAGFDSLYRAFLGSGAALVSARPTSANPAAVGDLQRALVDTAFGVGSTGLLSVHRKHVGDVEVGGKFLLLDSFGGMGATRIAPPPRAFNYRLAVGAGVRLGTGQTDAPDELTDIPTGEGQTDVGVRAIADLAVGRRAWATVLARYERQLPDDPELRVALPELLAFAPLYTRQRVHRDLGDVLGLEVTPRYAATRNLAFALYYQYRRKGADAYTGLFTLDSAATGIGATTLDAALLATGSTTREQRVGFGATYSTLGDYYRGRTRLPVDVSFVHHYAAAGRGYLPRTTTDEVSVRVYLRMWGQRPPREPDAPLTPPPATR